MKPANENEFLALRNSEHTIPIYCLKCGATFEKIVSLNIGVDAFQEVQQFSRRRALLGLRRASGRHRVF
jgi:hypothetical protein